MSGDDTGSGGGPVPGTEGEEGEGGGTSDVEESQSEQNLKIQGKMPDLNTGTMEGLVCDNEWDQDNVVVGYQNGTSDEVGSHTESESGRRW